MTITTIATWTETIDDLRKRDTRLNAAAACPPLAFPAVSNGFTIATSFLYDAQRVVEGERPLSFYRDGETAEALFESARQWARYGISFTPPGWEDVASVFKTLLYPPRQAGSAQASGPHSPQQAV